MEETQDLAAGRRTLNSQTSVGTNARKRDPRPNAYDWTSGESRTDQPTVCVRECVQFLKYKRSDKLSEQSASNVEGTVQALTHCLWCAVLCARATTPSQQVIGQVGRSVERGERVGRSTSWPAVALCRPSPQAIPMPPVSATSCLTGIQRTMLCV